MHTKYKGSSLRRGALKDLMPKKALQDCLALKYLQKIFFHGRASESRFFIEEFQKIIYPKKSFWKSYSKRTLRKQ